MGLIFTYCIQIIEFAWEHWISYPALTFIYFRYFPLFSESDVQNNYDNPLAIVLLGKILGAKHLTQPYGAGCAKAGKAKEKIIALKIQQDSSDVLLRKGIFHCMISGNFSHWENCKSHSEICPYLQWNEGLVSTAGKLGGNNSVDLNNEIQAMSSLLSQTACQALLMATWDFPWKLPSAPLIKPKFAWARA